jgi:hypothetical protein
MSDLAAFMTSKKYKNGVILLFDPDSHKFNLTKRFPLNTSVSHREVVGREAGAQAVGGSGIPRRAATGARASRHARATMHLRPVVVLQSFLRVLLHNIKYKIYSNLYFSSHSSSAY